MFLLSFVSFVFIICVRTFGHMFSGDNLYIHVIDLSPSHTGSYDFVIVRLVAIWSATTDRQCLLRSPFTIARSGVFFTIGCRSYVTLHDNLLFIHSGQL